MNRPLWIVGLLCIVCFGPQQVMAKQLIVFPNKGQSQDQMEKAMSECYVWAKQTSGFDPAQPNQPVVSTPSEAPEGGVVRGGLRGGLVGVTVGAIAGDAGKGAAIGAASGALVGGMRRRDQIRREEYAQQQSYDRQQAAIDERQDTFNRAQAACLEGKGYTVK